MVDSFDTRQSGAVALDGDASAKTGFAGFLATTAGKLVVGGIALVVVLAAIGAIVFFYVLNAGEPEPTGIIIPGSAATSASAEATITERPETSLQDTFAFRNVFEPSVKPQVTVTGSGSGGTATNPDGSVAVTTSVNPADVPANTIYLDSITTVDGVKMATFIWNGAVFTVKEGEQLAGTPWKLVRIEGNTAIMLFGDSMTTLTVGQGLGK